MYRDDLSPAVESTFANAPTIFTVAEAANLLKLSRAMIYRLCTRGRIAHFKLAEKNGVRIAKEDLMAYVQSKREPAKVEPPQVDVVVRRRAAPPPGGLTHLPLPKAFRR